MNRYLFKYVRVNICLAVFFLFTSFGAQAVEDQNPLVDFDISLWSGEIGFSEYHVYKEGGFTERELFDLYKNFLQIRALELSKIENLSGEAHNAFIVAVATPDISTSELEGEGFGILACNIDMAHGNGDGLLKMTELQKIYSKQGNDYLRKLVGGKEDQERLASWKMIQSLKHLELEMVRYSYKEGLDVPLYPYYVIVDHTSCQ